MPPSLGHQGAGDGSALFPLSLSPVVSFQSPEKSQDPLCLGRQPARQCVRGVAAGKKKKKRKIKDCFPCPADRWPSVALGGGVCSTPLQPCFCPCLLPLWVGAQAYWVLHLDKASLPDRGRLDPPPQGLCICPGVLQRDRGLVL